MIRKINLYGLLIFLAACLWGTSGIFVKTISDCNFSEMQMVLGRALFTFFILGVIILIKDKNLFKIKIKDLWLFASCGIFSIVFFNYCYFKTISLSSLSFAAVLMYTAPFFVVIISIFIFKQRLTLKKCIACLTAFFGCCLVSGIIGSHINLNYKAIIFGLLTGFGYGLYTIFSSILLKKGYNSLTINFYTFLFAAITSLIISNPIVFTKSLLFSNKAFVVLILMAIINTVIPYMLYNTGLKGVETTSAPIIATIEPVVATIIGLIFYKETVTLTGLIGIIMVLLSVAILNLKVGNTYGKNISQSICKN